MSYFEYHNKKVFYNVIGEGQPLVLLHGNAASSKMFQMMLPLYTSHFKVIVIDFLGHGLSERVDVFFNNLYEWEANQVIALLDYLDVGNVSIVGTSGGAWVAINVALMRKDLVNKVVADSFDGRSFANDFAENLIKEREYAKQDSEAIQFYEWCHGSDWESVVDLDTAALLTLANSKSLFCKPIEELCTALLMIGSKEDEMCRSDMLDEYNEIALHVPTAQIVFFEAGRHPLILSKAIEVFEQVKNYIG